MNTILSFMDKIYSDGKTLSIIYIVGAILLFVFIILLIISLRKPDKKEEQKILEEPKINDEPTEEIKKELIKEEIIDKKEEPEPINQSIFEKTVIIPLDELNKEENNVEKALNNIEKDTKIEEETKEEETKNISAEIPSVDDFVDSIVKKTYEKNEQFSSVYVENKTGTIELDKVLDNLNVDESVKGNIVPKEEKNEETEPNQETVEQSIEQESTTEKDDNKTITENMNSLDNLKKALDEKKKEVEIKQDDLKAKLDSLKKGNTTISDTMSAEDLLNKLNSLKEK